jgi:AbrB family looped-hinge helix DNA binding protein
MTMVTKIGRRGQTVIPAPVRRLLNLREGDRVAFVQRGEEIVLQPLNVTLLDLRGSVPVSGPQDLAAIRRQVIEQRARKAATDEG